MDQFQEPGFVELECFATCVEHVDQNRDPNARTEATNESSTTTREPNCYCEDCARGPLCEKDVNVVEGGHEDVLQVRKASQDAELQQRRPDMESQQNREIQRQLAHDRELHRRRPEVEAQRREIQRQVAELQASLDRELRQPEVEAQHREIQRQVAEMQASQYREAATRSGSTT